MDTRLAVIETHIDRLVEDVEEEKRERNKGHEALVASLVRVSDHLANQDRTINKGIGAILVLQVLIPVALEIWQRHK